MNNQKALVKVHISAKWSNLNITMTTTTTITTTTYTTTANKVCRHQDVLPVLMSACA